MLICLSDRQLLGKSARERNAVVFAVTVCRAGFSIYQKAREDKTM